MSTPRHALVIGGSRGLGRVLADSWSQTDRRVSVVSRTAKETSDRQRWTGWSADLSQPDQLTECLAQIVRHAGPVDDLVFAQRMRGGTDSWHDEIAVSLSGAATALSALESTWIAERQPSIVMITSLAARMVAAEQSASYHAAKAGQEELVRYYAVRLAACGVRVNAVAPGIVRRANAQGELTDLTLEQAAWLPAIPLGRLAVAQDVIDAITFLCSEQARYITGQTLIVDGGLSLMMQHSVAARVAKELKAGSPVPHSTRSD